MKSFLVCIIGCMLLSITAHAQDTAVRRAKPNPALKTMLVEASCGMCQFGLGGDDCKLAVRIKGKAYYVEGADIDDFGDAHAEDGFCNAIRKAKVQGHIKGKLFVVTWLQPVKTKSLKTKHSKA